MTRWVLASLLLALLASCSGDPAPAPRPVELTTGLSITPPSVIWDALSDTVRLRAVRETNLGRFEPNSAVSWSVEDPLVAQIDADGLARSQGEGATWVRAVRDGIVAEAEVQVTQAPSVIRVRPAHTSFVADNTVWLDALVLDRLGSPLDSPPVDWSSSDPTVVAVTGPGAFSGGIPGSVAIQATAGVARGFSSLRVAPKGWPNEPVGLDTLTNNSWASLAGTGWGHVNRQSESRIVVDSTAPMSPPFVLEAVYPEGYPSAGTEPAVDWFDVDGTAHELFVGMWFRASEPWTNHASQINKVLFLWNDAQTANLVFTMRGKPDGSYRMEMVAQGQPDARTAYNEQNVRSTPIWPGGWYRLEVHVVAPADGSPGSIRWYQDGELVGGVDQFAFVQDGWGQIEIAPTWGGVGGPPKPGPEFFRYDHLYISGR